MIELTCKNTQNIKTAQHANLKVTVQSSVSLLYFCDFVLSKYHKQYAYYNEKLNVSLRLHCIMMEVKKKML